MTIHPYSGRDNAVPCQEIGCRRTTFDVDALCCRHRSAAISPGSEAGECHGTDSPAGSSLSWLPAARDAGVRPEGAQPAAEVRPAL